MTAYTLWQRSWQQTTHRKKYRRRMKTGRRMTDKKELKKSLRKNRAQPRKCYIFCPEGDRVRLFEELDHKTAAPLIPAFQDYVLTSLQNRGDLRQLEVISQKERINAWV